jgi:uncharacterized phiE125 gp8 family phage protein
MSLVSLSGPPELVVSLAEAKAHLRVADDDSDEDAVIAGCIRQAMDTIDGASGWLGRCLTTQNWRLTLDAWPACDVIAIPLPPCQSVDSLTYIDPDGLEQAINDYVTYGIGGATPARLAHAYGSRWPATRCQGDAIQIDFTCGWPSFSDVPESVRAAVLLMTGALYDQCSENGAVTALLMPHRIW